MRVRSKALNVITHSCYLSQFELKKVDEALQDVDWVNSMHEELHQFVWNDVWELVARLEGVNVIGTSQMNMVQLLEIKLDLLLKVTHKWKGLTLMRLLQILLDITSHLNFKLYQMDVKSAFLNRMLQEEVYVEQPKAFY